MPRLAGQRRSDLPIHRFHRRDVDDLLVLQHLERVPHLMREEREQLIVTTLVLVRRHDDSQIPVAVGDRDERHETTVQMTERTIPELDVDNAVRVIDGVDK